MALHLDFIARPASGPRTAGWLLLLAAAAGAALLAQHHEAQRVAIDALLDRQAVLQGPLAVPRWSAAALAEAQQQLQMRWRSVVEPLAVPWPALFGALEAVPARGVVLSELLPDAQAGRLRLAGQAPSLQAALAYVDQLSAQPVLADTHLVQYAVLPDAAAGAISFVVEATWRRP